MKRKTTEEFIEQAKKIHGDRYDYSKVEYKKRDLKICIICPDLGIKYPYCVFENMEDLLKEILSNG